MTHTCERAYVQLLTARNKPIGYGVFTEWMENGSKHGRCLHQYRYAGGKSFRNCDTWEIALHCANTHRDDFNTGEIG